MSKPFKIFIFMSGLILCMIFTTYSEETYLLLKFVLKPDYEYHTSCYRETDRCLTVITVVEPHNTRYVVYGNKKYEPPLGVNYIEYYPSTNIAIVWENKKKCKIISNAEARLKMSVTPEVEIELIYDNSLLEDCRRDHPELVL